MSSLEIPFILRTDLDDLITDSQRPERVAEKKASRLLQGGTQSNRRGISCAALQPGAYFRPHKHPVAETFVWLRGAMQLSLLRNDGHHEKSYKLSDLGAREVVVPAGTYHVLQATEPDSALYTIFHGAYDAATHKEILEGSLLETEADDVLEAYLQDLREAREPF